MSTSFLLYYTAYVLILVVIAVKINLTVPQPYLDEIFHIPQTQAYCKGQWLEWNSAITTLPGLYAFSAGLGHIFNFSCTAENLRVVNLTFGALLPLLIQDILARLRSKDGKSTSRIECFSIALFPIVYFFNFLFYTDVASLFFVLASYDLALRKNYTVSAVVGIASLTLRQTNVVWIAFIGANSLLDVLNRAGLVQHDLRESNPKTLLFDALQAIKTAVIKYKTTLAVALPFLPVPISFAAFLVWNKGIVLGDKANHIPTMHLTQMFYFSACFAFFSAPHLVSRHLFRQTRRLLAGSIWRVMLSVGVLCAYIYIIKHYTIEHAFLLADNRHYMFYVWRKLIKQHWSIRFAAAPIYLVAQALTFSLLATTSKMPPLSLLIYTSCCAATLVPAPLIEPRYFIVPFVLLRLQLRPTRRQLIAESALFGVINALAIWTFLYRPFHWPSEPGNLQRFLW